MLIAVHFSGKQILSKEEDRPSIFRSYVAVHLEEETRKEALAKDWGAATPA